MHRFYLTPEQSRGPVLFLEAEEAHHAYHVLRLEPAQKVEILNGVGEIITCEVRASNKSSLELVALSRKVCAPLPCPITLVQALPKGKLFEDIVEKATELGVSCIVPLISERVISRPEGEDALRKLAKWQRTAIEALKQSGAAWLPGISPPTTLARHLAGASHVDLAFLASLQPDACELRECVARYHETHRRAPRSVSLWIGPEGDFSLTEIEQIAREAGARQICLGPWVLRTETATIAGLAMLNHELRQNVSQTGRSLQESAIGEKSVSAVKGF